MATLKPENSKFSPSKETTVVTTAMANSHSGSRLSQELHPMKNETVLALVFESCDVKTLKSCRLVSKMWKDVSLSSWRQKAVISLTNRKKTFAERNRLTLLELNRFVKSNPANRNRFDLPLDIFNKPFQCFKFNDLSFKYWRNYQFCLQSFQHHIKFLEIPFKMEEMPCNVLVNDIILKLPNLHKLRLNFDGDPYNFIPYAHKEITPIVPHHDSLKCLEVLLEGSGAFNWAEFLRIMPNLKRLKIGRFFNNFWWLEALLKAILSERNSNRNTESESKSKVLNLEELCIEPQSTEDYPVPEDGIRSICDSHLPLKRLAIYVGGVRAKVEVLMLLLETYAETLETVTVWTFDVANGSNPRIDSSISMTNLKELEVKSELTWGLTLVESLLVPKLERLILDWATSPDWMASKDEYKIRLFHNRYLLESVIFSQLHTFECKHDWRNFTPEKIRVFAKAMPNLKHLDVGLTSRSFREVCASWPKLGTLKTFMLEDCGDGIYEYAKEDMQIGDEAITGIPSEFEENIPILCHQNITDLKELTEFSIRQRLSSFVDPVSILTDRSVIHGFLKLPRLHKLEVEFKEISPANIDSLKACVPICNITVNNKKI